MQGTRVDWRLGRKQQEVRTRVSFSDGFRGEQESFFFNSGHDDFYKLQCENEIFYRGITCVEVS